MTIFPRCSTDLLGTYLCTSTFLSPVTELYMLTVLTASQDEPKK